jgi:hypothetical protein
MAGIAQDGDRRHGHRWRTAIWGTAAFVLLLPWLAMQFTREMAWDLADFVILGAMLVAACGTYEFATRITGNAAYRAGVVTAVATAFILIWLNLAVGIIGNEGNPANLMFGGVIAIGIVGALIARFQPRGMALALVATAIAQALVAVVAGTGHTLILSAFFVALWLVSARLFWKAAREQDRAAS